GHQHARHHHRDGDPRSGACGARAAQRAHRGRHGDRPVDRAGPVAPHAPGPQRSRAGLSGPPQHRRHASRGPRPAPESSMFGYYFNLALRSFRRNRALTALMVMAIALGIGACMTTLTVFRVLSGDPIPGKSGQLFYVQLDPAVMRGFVAGEDPAQQVTRFDAETMLREKRGDRQAMMTGGGVSVTPDNASLIPFIASARYTSADFFPMF